MLSGIAGFRPVRSELKLLTSRRLHPTPRPYKAASASQTHRSSSQASPSFTGPPPETEPPPPKPPDWPANDEPSEATVVWNSQGLRIEASNSSLSQIMKDVSQGDRRQGRGPGCRRAHLRQLRAWPARDVLAKLLDGSGYNVLMIGDQGQGTPRQMCSAHESKGDAQPAANNQTTARTTKSDADDQPAPAAATEPQPPATRNGFAPGAPPRTPQQIMQEMQQRQQQQPAKPAAIDVIGSSCSTLLVVDEPQGPDSPFAPCRMQTAEPGKPTAV